ncbi:Mycothiol S-conjugate amidase [Polaribacter huanghezhanensis]|uniref:PIG-L family deacetylase n=1 Tax=Polaribacter huanghezhanensis TaxID=1354726 RepID=UPI002647C63F|nr:PIG-L family deacetylase [Polaribacter huanghezhanensis]WKD86311.1 Mycothiol S-conjugate amidase [Polaribacter huanghezhanensis]
MKKRILILFPFLFLFISIHAQKPQKLSSNQIYEKIQKLNFLGSALYIAAHPDDENTRLISYLANHEKARTGYLSLTRGDGGQNLIGPEIRELLGLIRTEELLAARRIDGGEQFFTRANDFGYSKNPKETLEFWEKDKVLSDVVWAIRTFKPDVIINRFNHRTPGTTHGHHTTSAMLSVAAFDLANDATKYPNQLKYTETWQPKRLFFNTSSWFYNNQKDFEKATKGKLTSFDVGVYYPLKGLSNNEIAALASSQHLCQGFGRLTTRGTQFEYLEFLKGDKPKDTKDIFSGINTTWNRIKGGGEIGAILYDVEKNFDFSNPSKHLPALLNAYDKIQLLEDAHWREIKLKQIKEIIEAAAGLYLEVSATNSSTTPNGEVTLKVEALNRSDITTFFDSYRIKENRVAIVRSPEKQLENNVRVNITDKIQLKNKPYSDPYWLQEKGTLGMYTVKNQLLIGKPESDRPLQVEFNLNIWEHNISFTKNVVYRYSRSDVGEIYEPFEVLPEVTTKLSNKVLIFSDNSPQKVAVLVRAGTKNVRGFVSLEVPANWTIFPNQIPFSIAQKGDNVTVDFMVTPPVNQSEGILKSIATIDGKIYNKELIEINYNHIPKQSVLLNSEAKVVRLNIQKNGNYIGYITGAGDEIPESLRQIGYTVIPIDPNEINEENLHKFDAIVLGVRAYNTVDALKFKQKFLLDYVEKGGNMIVQYNTAGRGGIDVGAPFKLHISRDRVTDETAKVSLLAKNHSLLNFPNKIEASDFDGWVQERGLYFPDEWSKQFTPILSMHDKDEPARNGSLLVAKHGKGHYIYTGLSFFRELPAGVSGAYKLFANMLSIGKENIQKQTEIKE